MREVREPAVAYGRNKFTEELYLQIEKSSVEKHEFYKGEIFGLSGADARHNIFYKLINCFRQGFKTEILQACDKYPSFAFGYL